MANLTEFLLGLASIGVALLVYYHSKRRQRDSFLERLTEAYASFWSDPEMREVRSWIANDNAFEEIKDILAQRRAQNGESDAAHLSAKDYIAIDKIDRFCSLMTLIVALHIEFRHKGDVWATELWEYWLRACFSSPSRSDLSWYLRAYWSQLAAVGSDGLRLRTEKSASDV